MKITYTMPVVDLVPLYPIAISPQITVDIRAWYIATYKDRFFTDPPVWFKTYMLLEAFYHIPLSLWAVPALLRDDVLLPLHLMVWACETMLTTLTCVVEAMSWEGFTVQEKVALAQLYVPYLLLGSLFLNPLASEVKADHLFDAAIGMGADMFWRLKGQLTRKAKEA
jgi:hypothetical protein